jgi:Cu2+-containing amine oxidase
MADPNHLDRRPPTGVRSVFALSPGRTGYLSDEAVDNQDVVVWYAVHVHHPPRTEDWPHMAMDWVGFTLKPRDFLDSSPVQPIGARRCCRSTLPR